MDPRDPETMKPPSYTGERGPDAQMDEATTAAMEDWRTRLKAAHAEDVRRAEAIRGAAAAHAPDHRGAEGLTGTLVSIRRGAYGVCRATIAPNPGRTFGERCEQMRRAVALHQSAGVCIEMAPDFKDAMIVVCVSPSKRGSHASELIQATDAVEACGVDVSAAHERILFTDAPAADSPPPNFGEPGPIEWRPTPSPLFWIDNDGTVHASDPPTGYLGTSRILTAVAVAERHNAMRQRAIDAHEALRAHVAARALPASPTIVTVSAETRERARALAGTIADACRHMETNPPVAFVPLARGEGLAIDPVDECSLRRIGFHRLTLGEASVVEAMRRAGATKEPTP